FSARGDRVATSSDDNLTRVWDTQKGELCGRPWLHRGTVRLIAFSPDSRLLFTYGSDHTARVGDAELGLPVTPIWPLSSPASAAVVSDDGRTVAARLEDGKVRTWDLSPDERPLEDLERLAVVLSARYIDPRSGMLPIDLGRLMRLWKQ